MEMVSITDSFLANVEKILTYRAIQEDAERLGTLQGLCNGTSGVSLVETCDTAVSTSISPLALATGSTA
jgi:hypothetical protein